jgi:hypothetical protein
LFFPCCFDFSWELLWLSQVTGLHFLCKLFFFLWCFGVADCWWRDCKMWIHRRCLISKSWLFGLIFTMLFWCM